MKKAGKTIISWQEIEADTRLLANKLKENKANYKGIVAVTRGGLGVAALISRLLDIKLIDTICLASYEKESNKRKAVEVYKSSSMAAEDQGAGWLVIDDLIDSGYTYSYISKLLPKADFAFLYNKSNTEEFTKQVVYVKTYPSDTWIVLPWEID